MAGLAECHQLMIAAVIFQREAERIKRVPGVIEEFPGNVAPALARPVAADGQDPEEHLLASPLTEPVDVPRPLSSERSLNPEQLVTRCLRSRCPTGDEDNKERCDHSYEADTGQRG